MRLVVRVPILIDQGPLQGQVRFMRRVISTPVGVDNSILLYCPTARLDIDRSIADPAGGVCILCRRLDGAHFIPRLRECLFEEEPDSMSDSAPSTSLE
jgi:hypothetical protein